MKKFFGVLLMVLFSLILCISVYASDEKDTSPIEYTNFVLGDVNGDEEITNADVLMVFRYIYNPKLYPLNIESADVNKDGEITNADVLKMFRYIYNPSLYPIENFSSGLEYKLVGDTYTVTGIGTCTDARLVIPDEYEGLPVTAISSYAFSNCTNLKSVVIPDSVTSIGNAAFSGCTSLEKMQLPFIGESVLNDSSTSYHCALGHIFGVGTSSVYANANVPDSIRQVIITQDTTIPYRAFAYCKFIETISLPDGIESIGDYAFENCTALKNIDGGFDSVTYIGGAAFRNCTALTRIGKTEKVIYIPQTVTSLGGSSFYNCVNFETLTIDMVGEIQASTFSGCTGLKNITIADTITSIGAYAFQNCSITEIVVPDSVTSIGNAAFSGCTSLEKMQLPFIGESVLNDSPTYSSSFGYSYHCALGHIFGVGTSSVYANANVPDSIRQVIITQDTTIPYRAFAYCKFIETISLPDGIESIGDYAFSGCTNLTNIYFGGTKADWNGIQFGSNWDRNSDNYYIHYNAFEYGIYLPTGFIKLLNAEKEFFLFPTGATAEVQVLNIKTGEIIPISETDIKLELSYTNGALLLNSEYLTGKGGGLGNISAYYVKDGKKIVLESSMPIFVADCEDFNISGSSMKFSESERDYIRLCLDMYHSLYKVSHIENIVDVDLNFIEQMVLGFDNLGDYIAGFLEGDLTETTILKKAFSKFIQNYVDNKYAHSMAVNDTKMILAGMEAVHDLYEDNSTWIGLPKDILDLIRDVNDCYILAQTEGLARSELNELAKTLMELNDYSAFSSELRKTKAWTETVAETRKSFDYYKDAVNRFELHTQKNSLLYQIMDSDARVKLFKDSVPGKLETGMMVLDSVIYMLNDYSRNIEVLEIIREQMLSKECGYTHKDIEVHVIDELILEYHNKYIEGVNNLLTSFAGETIATIATKHPILSIVKIASGITTQLTAIDEKAEWLALSCYRDALYRCIYPIDNLYFNGSIDVDTMELKQFVSLYLSILLKSNELATTIAIHDSSDADFTDNIYEINYNISVLKNLSNLYCK